MSAANTFSGVGQVFCNYSFAAKNKVFAERMFNVSLALRLREVFLMRYLLPDVSRRKWVVAAGLNRHPAPTAVARRRQRWPVRR